MTLRILVIDDDVTIRTSLADALATEGTQVGVASNAQEAHASLQEGPLDIVFSDVKMPGADGIELLARFAPKTWS